MKKMIAMTAQEIYSKCISEADLYIRQEANTALVIEALRGILPHLKDAESALKLWDTMMDLRAVKDVYEATQDLWPIFPTDDIQKLLGLNDAVVGALSVFLARPKI